MRDMGRFMYEEQVCTRLQDLLLSDSKQPTGKQGIKNRSADQTQLHSSKQPVHIWIRSSDYPHVINGGVCEEQAEDVHHENQKPLQGLEAEMAEMQTLVQLLSLLHQRSLESIARPTRRLWLEPVLPMQDTTRPCGTQGA